MKADNTVKQTEWTAQNTILATSIKDNLTKIITNRSKNSTRVT